METSKLCQIFPIQMCIAFKGFGENLCLVGEPSGAGLWNVQLEILQEKGILKQIYASKEFLSFVNYFRLAWTGLKGRTETLLDAN